MTRRSRLVVSAFVLLPVFLGSRSHAAVTIAGHGIATITLRVGERVATCVVPMTLTLQTDVPGFVLTQSYAPKISSNEACGVDGVVQATHVASDLTPPAHRCYVNSPAGGVGISSSPYALELENGTYTITRVDRVACSYDIVTDTMKVTPGQMISFTRDMSLGASFLLTVRATVPRLS